MSAGRPSAPYIDHVGRPFTLPQPATADAPGGAPDRPVVLFVPDSGAGRLRREYPVRMHIRELVLETYVHLAPLKMLEDLSGADAVRPPAAHMHSVAGLVAHMEFWQHWFLQRCRGVATPMPSHAADGWPDVSAAGWDSLRARFEAGLHEVIALGEQTDGLAEPVAPAIEMPSMATYSRQDALVHIAQHNSHHLGQVVSARQVLGLWPPRAGSWTW